jgi:hypothetical protein
MKTVNERIDELKAQFRKLSPKYQAELVSRAKAYIEKYPHMADASIFWRGLSARQVIAAK